MIDELLPGEAFIINDYMSMGTLPVSGITFLDESGERWFFSILQNQAGEGDPYRLIEFQLKIDAFPSDWIAPW